MAFSKNSPIAGDVVESVHIRNIEDYIENLITINDGVTDIDSVVKLIFNTGFDVSGNANDGITITPSATDNVTTSGNIQGGNITATGDMNAVNLTATGDVNTTDVIATGDVSGNTLTITDLITALRMVLTGNGTDVNFIQTFFNSGDTQPTFQVDSNTSNETTISLGAGGTTAPDVFIKRTASGVTIQANNIDMNGNLVINEVTNKQTDLASASTTLSNENRILVNFAGAVTINLPTAVGIKGKKFAIIDASGNASTNNITVDGATTETINGNLTEIIDGDYGYVEVESDGANWLIVNKSSAGNVAPSSIVTEDGLTTALYNGFTYNKVVSTSSIDITGFFVQVDNCPIGQSASIQVQINGVNSGSPIAISNGTESVFAVNNQTLTAGDKISFIASSVVGVDVGNDIYLGAYI